jgi:ethanolamine utilization protein EutJ
LKTNVNDYISQMEAVMVNNLDHVQLLHAEKDNNLHHGRNFRVGVDLGTAYTVLTVLDEENKPLAGAYRFAQVVRDGLVVDFVGAVDLLKELKQQVESRLGVELTSATTGYPPGIPQAEVRATGHVLEAAGLQCDGLVDEPTAANYVLGIDNGAIVDVGGGTTGIAVFRDGKVIYTADEPTGGTHFTLTIAGALDIPFEKAEELKTNLAEQPRLFPVVRPVMEKVASIIQKHISDLSVDMVYLVGGTCMYPHIAEVIEERIKIHTVVPANPLFVTPLGIAIYHATVN